MGCDSADDAVCRKVLQDRLASLCVIPSCFIFIFYYLNFVFFSFCLTVSYIELNCYCSNECQQLFVSWNHTILKGKKLCIRVRIMITFFGKFVLHTHDSWRWRNFSVQSGDDSHVSSPIHHCRDQPCSPHQGSDNSWHPVCLVWVPTRGQACSMSQAGEIHGWSLKIAVLGLNAHGMNPGSVWAWVPGLAEHELCTCLNCWDVT